MSVSEFEVRCVFASHYIRGAVYSLPYSMYVRVRSCVQAVDDSSPCPAPRPRSLRIHHCSSRGRAKRLCTTDRHLTLTRQYLHATYLLAVSSITYLPVRCTAYIINCCDSRWHTVAVDRIRFPHRYTTSPPPERTSLVMQFVL